MHPSLPQSELCIPALNFVHWYTQHPANQGPPPLETTKHVTLIGNGNVALDVARMLLTSPDVLRKYDVPSTVVDTLERSAVQHVSIAARRGPFDAAFTTKEIRELIKLPNASMKPIPEDWLVPAPGAKIDRAKGRIVDLLRKGSEQPYGSTAKTWSLDFFRSPVSLEGNKLTLAHTTAISPSTRVVPTGETSTVDTDLVVTSIGFKGDPASPFYDPELGHMRTQAGRVQGAMGNVYGSGWAAMGPKGVIVATMMDAYAVAETILGDREKSLTPLKSLGGEATVDLGSVPGELVGNKGVIDYEDWKKVDAAEVTKGESMGKERERLTWGEVQALLGRA